MPTTHTSSIIAACDGADRGRQAVALGRIIAEATGAQLTIAAVYPHPGLPFPPPVAHHVDERHRAHRAIRAVRDDLAPGARTVVVPGLSPAHALCKLADDEGASMIVVGSRHAAAERRMADADHALQVLRSAQAAVLVAPDDRPVSPTTIMLAPSSSASLQSAWAGDRPGTTTVRAPGARSSRTARMARSARCRSCLLYTSPSPRD